jgi:hypothetical protein
MFIFPGPVSFHDLEGFRGTTAECRRKRAADEEAEDEREVSELRGNFGIELRPTVS